MNRLLSRKLIIEGMRQLRLVGIIGTILAVLCSFFIAYGSNVNAEEVNEYRSQMAEYALEKPYVVEMAGSRVCIPVKITAFVLAPLFTLILFGFLNKRNASDFYHGIADKRECLYNSFSLAALMWCVIIMLASFITAVVSVGLMSGVVLSDDFFPATLLYMLEALITAFYLAAVMTLSMSLSGTLIADLAVAVMILFLPKILYLTSVAASDIAVYPFAYDSSILSGRYNLVTSWFNYFTGTAYEKESWKSCLYTVLVGAVLYVAGCAAFKHRKSEAATQAAVTGRLQLVFRLIPAFVITIVPCMVIYGAICRQYQIERYETFELIVFYVLAVIAYFLYEIITARRRRGLVKIIPGLLVLVLLDGIYIGAMVAEREAILGNVPDHADSVRLLGNSKGDMDTDSYFFTRLSEIEISDERVIAVLTEGLEENIEEIRNGSYAYSGKNRVLAEFTSNGKKLYRLVFIDDSDYAYISSIMADGESNDLSGVITGIMELPYTDVEMTVFDYKLKDADKRNIMESYMESVEKLSSDDIGDIIFEEIDSDAVFGFICLSLVYKSEIYSVRLPIFYSMDCVSEYISIMNGYVPENITLIEDFITDVLKQQDDEGEMSSDTGLEIRYMRAATTGSGRCSYNTVHMLFADSDSVSAENERNAEILLEIEEILEECETLVFKEGMDYVQVSYTAASDGQVYKKIYVMDKNLKERLQELMNEFLW